MEAVMEVSITHIKAWRGRNPDATLRDYFNAHGICWTCKGMGSHTGFNPKNNFVEVCKTCEGKGRKEENSKGL